jgi:hypothetical protein
MIKTLEIWWNSLEYGAMTEWKRHLSCFFETGLHYIGQAGLKLAILLPQPPEFWD